MSRPGDSTPATPQNSQRRDGAVARLRRAITSASSADGSKTDLEAAAMELVDELKAAQHPPEQMLLQIKRILAEAGLRPSYGSAEELGPFTGAHTDIYRTVIQSSIRFYYDGRQS
jgi:hypothetical protein